MQPTMRPYGTETDYWRVRGFLREVFLLNGRRERSWQVARLDYWRWHVLLNCEECDTLVGSLFLWEAADGRLAAVLNNEGKGDAWLQVHPAFRTSQLEEEMMAVAEEQLATTGADGRRSLRTWANVSDKVRQEILERRGYVKGASIEYQRRRWLQGPIPEAPSPAGYKVRALGGPEELPARSWASWRGFHPDEPDDKYEGWEWYRNVQRAPLYRRDLDVVAEAPDGSIASFCTLWYDDVTRTGCFEPVATVPEHQRLGLGKAVMCEAMRRLKSMGGVLATVAGFTEAANALYSSAVSPEYEMVELWRKTW